MSLLENMKSPANKMKWIGALSWTALVFSCLLCQTGCTTSANDRGGRWDSAQPWVSETRNAPSSGAEASISAASMPASTAGAVSRAGAPALSPQKGRPPPETVSISFDNTPLPEVVDFFRRVTGLNFVIDQQAVEELGGAQNLRVSLRLTDVKLRNALYHSLEPMGLAWCIRHEAIVITTPQRAEEKTDKQTYIYSIQDLSLVPANSAGGAASSGSASNGASGNNPSNGRASRGSGR